MSFYESRESEMLKKYISDKKQYLSKLENKFAYQLTQKEILFFEQEILPIILRSTNILHSEVANYAVKAFETALKYKCNDLTIGFHLDDNYSDKPTVGIAYPKLLEPFGTPGAMNIIFDVMDGNGVPARPFNLPIHELI